MTDNRKQQFFEVAFKDEETAKKLLVMTPEEVSAYLAAEGHHFSVEEIKEIGAEIQAEVDALGDDELDDEALENVAGGKGQGPFSPSNFVKALVVGGIIICLTGGGW